MRDKAFGNEPLSDASLVSETQHLAYNVSVEMLVCLYVACNSTLNSVVACLEGLLCLHLMDHY